MKNKSSSITRWKIGAALLGFALFLSGCRQDETIASQSAATAPTVQPAPTSAPPATAVYDPSGGRPQAKLQTVKLWIATNQVVAELAVTRRQIETGMMWRTNMAEMEGMLFIFPQPHQAAFYMKNTLLPLSCAYIDPEGTILEIHNMTPRDETTIRAASDQVQYVLEMNQGWFERHDIRPGVAISTEHGPLSQTFFRRR